MCETRQVVRATQPCSNSERATTEIYSVVQLHYLIYTVATINLLKLQIYNQ